MRILSLVTVGLLVAAPVAAAKEKIPPELDKAARRLLKEAARSTWYREFRKNHRKQKPLVGVYLHTTSTEGTRGVTEGPDGVATAIVRAQGSFAVLAVNGKKPANAYGQRQVEGGKPAKKKAPRWIPVANLHFEANLVNRTIRLDLLGPDVRGKVEWAAAMDY